MVHDAFGEPDDGMMDVPIPFPGTRDQAMANHRSHIWTRDDRCGECEVRAGSTSSFYRCGASIPRMKVKRGSPEAEAALRRSIGIPID